VGTAVPPAGAGSLPPPPLTQLPIASWKFTRNAWRSSRCVVVPSRCLDSDAVVPPAAAMAHHNIEPETFPATVASYRHDGPGTPKPQQPLLL
jgi:hypothetical protein